MKHVFVRFKAKLGEDEEKTNCIIFSGKSAQNFLDNPEGFIKDWNGGSPEEVSLFDSWEFPENLPENAGKKMLDIFETLLGLNVLADDCVVSDLFTTIFEAGYQLCEKNKT